MQKKIFGGLFVLLVGMLIFASCAKDTLVPPAPVVINPNLKISFKDTIQPIFTANCLGSCHSGTIAPDLRSGKAYSSLTSGNYINTATPEQSKIYTEMATGGAMSGHCTTDDAALVLAWIKQGALDN